MTPTLPTSPNGRRYLVGDRFSAADLTFAALSVAAVRPPEYGDAALALSNLEQLPPKTAAEVCAFRAMPVVERQQDWTLLTKSIAKKWLNEGLQSRCITRDLSWGVPVPRAGFENKVFYVWFDAPIGYLAATKAWENQVEERDWLDWWQNSDDVRYVQFMAKDNLPFHTIMFPAMILGTQEPWKLADQIKGFNWLNYYGGKFSTSAKRGVFLDQALDVLPADYWRYSLIAMAPESSDSAFTWEQLQTKINKDLADNLGNFVNRILKFAASRFDRIQTTIPKSKLLAPIPPVSVLLPSTTSYPYPSTLRDTSKAYRVSSPSPPKTLSLPNPPLNVSLPTPPSR